MAPNTGALGTCSPCSGKAQWRRFEQAIDRAKESCAQSGNEPGHHFAGVGKMIELGRWHAERDRRHSHSENTVRSPLPPLTLQNQFAAIVEKVEGIKGRYQQSLADLETLYGALSQKVFAGGAGSVAGGVAGICRYGVTEFADR